VVAPPIGVESGSVQVRTQCSLVDDRLGRTRAHGEERIVELPEPPLTVRRFGGPGELTGPALLVDRQTRVALYRKRVVLEDDEQLVTKAPMQLGQRLGEASAARAHEAGEDHELDGSIARSQARILRADGEIDAR
jgi:hypothetical protein